MANLTALRYINWVLRPVLLPFLQHQPRLVSTGQCQTSHSSCGATALPRKQRQCFATDRTMGSSWPSNSLCPSPPMNREREREKNVLFNDALNTCYLRLYGVRHMVKDHSDSDKGNPLPPHRLLLSINSKGYFMCTIP